MANLFLPSIIRVVDSQGNPINGASLSFYLTTTTTNATWYTDSAGAIPGTNPLVSNSVGEFAPVYLNKDTTYRVILKDDLGNTLWDLDPVKGFDESQFQQIYNSVSAANSNVTTLASQVATNALNAQVSAGAASSSAAQASASASLAVSAQLVANVYPNDYASTLPQGVTSVAITGAGSGGTTGTYALGVSGGPTGFAGTYTIAGGVVTAITITNPGLSTSTTAPTLSFPSGSVTGATATATVGSLIANQKVYWAATSDSKGLALWQNSAGTVVAVNNPDSSQIIIYNQSATDSIVGSLTGVSGNFIDANMSNLNDPSYQPSGLFATRAAQVNQTFNLTTGALNTQSTTSFPTWCAWIGPALNGGSTYTMNLTGAPSGAFWDIASHLPFYTSGATFSSSETTGFTVSADKKSVTFTVPGTGQKRPVMNIRDISSGWTSSNPMTLAYANSILNNVMVTATSTTDPFVKFRAAGSKDPDPVVFNLTTTTSITVAVQSGYAFIRAPLQLSSTEDVVWHVLLSETPIYTAPGIATKTGVVDFLGVRIISRSFSSSQTIAAYNLSSQVWSNGIDERVPVHINGHYIGGGHGIDSYSLSVAGHDKTSADIGSQWIDNTSKVWILTKIPDANTLLFTADNTGASDKWVITTLAPSGTTLTHLANASHTSSVSWTSATLGALTPILQNLSVSLFVDEVQIDLTTDGVYTGSRVRIEDDWDIPNVASLLSYLKTNIGSTDYTNSSISIQVGVNNTYSWNKWGAMTAYHTHNVKQAYSRSAGTVSATGDYDGGIQLQRLSLVGDSTPGSMTSVWAYCPNLSTTVGGYDLQAVANVTSNSSLIAIPKTSCSNPSDPASHFAMIGKDGSNAVVGGVVYGYARSVGMGVPATRAASVTIVGNISPAEKLYPSFVDVAAGDAVAGQVLVAVAFRGYFKPTDSALTIPAFIYTVGQKHYAIITSHQVQTKKWVALPKELIGWNAKAIKIDTGVTLEGVVGSTVPVQAKGVLMSFANSYGDAVLELSTS